MDTDYLSFTSDLSTLATLAPVSRVYSFSLTLTTSAGRLNLLNKTWSKLPHMDLYSRPVTSMTRFNGTLASPSACAPAKNTYEIKRLYVSFSIWNNFPIRDLFSYSEPERKVEGSPSSTRPLGLYSYLQHLALTQYRVNSRPTSVFCTFPDASKACDHVHYCKLI